jgi:chromosome segregation ATPase
MRKIYRLILFCLLAPNLSYAQEGTTVSEQIKIDRDNQLKELNEKLKRNEEVVKTLTERLTAIDTRRTTDKVAALERLQKALDNRLNILEAAPITKIGLNGQLAFTELLSIQRDIQPASLFLTSQSFFTQLGNVSNIQQYKVFNEWKTEYDQWYTKQKNHDQMLEFVNSSVNLISNAANKVPLYGSIVQTVSSGVSTIITSVGKKDKELVKRTPTMLKLLNIASQFEQQKSEIDHEWESINKELGQLQNENNQLLHEQLDYYGLNKNDYEKKYFRATLDSEREDYKKYCRNIIEEKFTALDTSATTKGKWLGQVETYMYKVQSLRLRFGQLTSRMLSNIERYEQLIAIYSDNSKFPAEFTVNVNNLGKTLATVKNKFNESFNPARYIEDSAVMYIERK